MKAVVFEQFGGPEVLKYVDLPTPVPAEGQVLVKLVSAGVCKADWRVRTGRCQWLTCPFPVTLGYEMAGRVEALGPSVPASRSASRYKCFTWPASVPTRSTWRSPPTM